MKKIILPIAALTLIACSEEPGLQGDTIGLETRELTFGPARDTLEIKTKGNDYALIFAPGMTYLSWPRYDTLEADWLKVIALPGLQKIKVIASENRTDQVRQKYVQILDHNFETTFSVIQEKRGKD